MRHKEAFCVMYYKCDTCNHTTSFWNSRDGVTPFCCGCILEGCKGTMQHEYFASDRLCAKIPEVATHVWIDMTQEKAQAYADTFWRLHGEKMMEVYPHLAKIGEIELRKSKVEEIYHEGEAPDKITRLEGRQRSTTGTETGVDR